MSKQINPSELAILITTLLTNPDSIGELDSSEKFSEFMTDITETVCAHVGGEIHGPAQFVDDAFYIGIHGNDSLPDHGGVWANYDPEGQL